MVPQIGTNLPVPVLANLNYKQDVVNLGDQHEESAGQFRNSSRFSRAAALVRHCDGKTSAVDYAFTALDKVSQGNFTKWQVVYDIGNHQIHFRTLDHHSRKVIDLSLFDFSSGASSVMLDVNTRHDGPVNDQFRIYTTRANNRLIQTALQGYNAAGILQIIRPEHVAYIQRIVASCLPAQSEASPSNPSGHP